MKIILDSNMLMVPGQFNVDIFEELGRLGYTEFIVPKTVLKELNILKNRYKGKNKASVDVAISLAERCEILDEEGFADAVISKLASKEVAVATNDKRLIKELRGKGIRVVRLRQKKLLCEE
ncbi:MAG: Ribonuclease VapC9 [Candidatus Methanolliviera sp. GoM_asphalt]|nr:MAG: Ribonuclease VapC9 [Candidatus Methanolliviera sp. GoM_asphalt]